MTTYLSENFDATTVGTLPSGWTSTLGGWSVQTAPAGMSGRALQAASTAGDVYVYKAHTRVTSGKLHTSVTFKTATTFTGPTRALQVRNCDGSHSAMRHGILVYGATVYGVDANTNIGIPALSTDTVYTLEWWLDLTTDRVDVYKLNGTVYNNSGSGWAIASTAGLDYIAFNSYSAGTFNLNHDAILIDDALFLTAPGTPTITSVTPNRFGEEKILLTQGSGDNPSSFTVERRPVSGGTWYDCSAVSQAVDLTGGNWKIRVMRTDYGTGSAALGTQFQYRVTATNTGGSSSASAVVSSSGVTYIDPQGLINDDMARLAASFVASGVGYLSSSIAEARVYPGEVMLQMAWGFQRTGTTAYRTHALNQLTYIGTLLNGDDLLQFPESNYRDYIYGDHHWRTAYHIAASARLFLLAGDTTSAQTCTDVADRMATAIFTKLNGGAPDHTETFGSYLPNSQIAWPASTVVTAGDIYRPTSANSHAYRVLGTPGQTFNTGSTQPSWPTGTGAEVTQGGVTYRETGATGKSLYRLYNPTTPYAYHTGSGEANFDLNQQTEVAALLSLLTTSPLSDFYIAGSLRTRALDVIQGTTALATVYQGYDYDRSVHGGVSIGYDSSFATSYHEYDTLYGSFTLETLAVVLALSGSQHAAHAPFLASASNWLLAQSSEPIVGARWATGLQTTESWFAAACRYVGFTLLGTTSSIYTRLWESCFQYPPNQDSSSTAFAIENTYVANGHTSAASPAYVNRSDFEPLAILAAAELQPEQTVAVGQATESDEALAVTLDDTTVAVGLASETDTALPVTAVLDGLPQTISVGIAEETDTALPVVISGGDIPGTQPKWRIQGRGRFRSVRQIGP